MEMNIGRERMRPGSGFLAVRILADGPTRVLQITDIRNRNVIATLMTKVCIAYGNTVCENYIFGESMSDRFFDIPELIREQQYWFPRFPFGRMDGRR